MTLSTPIATYELSMPIATVVIPIATDKKIEFRIDWWRIDILHNTNTITTYYN
jgi:hypothetical protein